MKINFNNIDSKINEYIADNFYTGAVINISENNKIIYSKSYGYRDLENKIKMTDDSIFRAYSMTKPLTVLAFLILVDRQLISLEDKLEDYFSEYKNVKVLDSKNSTQSHEIKKPIKMKHLLSMTSGMTYFGNKNETQKQTTILLKKWATKNNKNSFMTLQELVKELAKIPLLFEPGSGWNYGLSLDVIGGVIEKISKMSFRDFVFENILKPLEMNDSDFMLIDKNREAHVYDWKLENNKNVLTKHLDFNFLIQELDKIPPSPMGGAGLFTSAPDYIKFLNLLMTGKNNSNETIISKNILNLMKKNHIQDVRSDFKWTLNNDYSYGYGVRIREENTNYPLTEVGEYGWDGLLGSTGLVDEKNNIAMCLMLSTNPGHNKLIETDFFNTFYESIKK